MIWKDGWRGAGADAASARAYIYPGKVPRPRTLRLPQDVAFLRALPHTAVEGGCTKIYVIEFICGAKQTSRYGACRLARAAAATSLVLSPAGIIREEPPQFEITTSALLANVLVGHLVKGTATGLLRHLQIAILTSSVYKTSWGALDARVLICLSLGLLNFTWTRSALI